MTILLSLFKNLELPGCLVLDFMYSYVCYQVGINSYVKSSIRRWLNLLKKENTTKSSQCQRIFFFIGLVLPVNISLKWYAKWLQENKHKWKNDIFLLILIMALQ